MKLLPANTTRWTPIRKRRVIYAIDYEELTFNEAMKMYGLSRDELWGWYTNFHAYGLGALKSTHTQYFRRAAPSWL